MFVNIGMYIYKFWMLLFCAPLLFTFFNDFTLHEAKQPLATRNGFTRGKEKKRNTEGLSNDQRSQMHAYIALKKMQVAD